MTDRANRDGDAIEEALALVRQLPAGVVAALFGRYGKPLEGALPALAPGDRWAEIAVAQGQVAVVRVLQVRTAVDVIANDWFVLDAPGADPLAVAGPLFAAALRALSRAARPAGD